MEKYVPVAAIDIVHGWIYHYDIKLKIRRERSTRLGDYTPPVKGNNHVITLNHNLNPYAFLITFVHEVAHLVTWNSHRDLAKPHGAEWKASFRQLMQPFFKINAFPHDLEEALKIYLNNPSASSCSDPHLYKAIKKHDTRKGFHFLEELPAGALFLLDEKKQFKKGPVLRTRFHCTEVTSGREYFVSKHAEVRWLQQPIITPGNTLTTWN